LTSVDRGSQVKKEYLRLFPEPERQLQRTRKPNRARGVLPLGRTAQFQQYAGPVTLPDAELPPSSTNRIVVSNAAIKAWSANTLKARLEYYFEGVGQISVGAFRRDFENFFGSTTFRRDARVSRSLQHRCRHLWAVRRGDAVQHSGQGRMTGCEFDYKQALTFLPHWARGVQVFANATATRAHRRRRRELLRLCAARLQLGREPEPAEVQRARELELSRDSAAAIR
jgi:hypothetical protein